MDRPEERGMQTDAVHAGEGVDAGARPVILPVYTSSTYCFETTADLRRYLADEDLLNVYDPKKGY